MLMHNANFEQGFLQKLTILIYLLNKIALILKSSYPDQLHFVLSRALLCFFLAITSIYLKKINSFKTDQMITQFLHRKVK